MNKKQFFIKRWVAYFKDCMKLLEYLPEDEYTSRYLGMMLALLIGPCLLLFGVIAASYFFVMLGNVVIFVFFASIGGGLSVLKESSLICAADIRERVLITYPIFGIRFYLNAVWLFNTAALVFFYLVGDGYFYYENKADLIHSYLFGELLMLVVGIGFIARSTGKSGGWFWLLMIWNLNNMGVTFLLNHDLEAVKRVASVVAHVREWFFATVGSGGVIVLTVAMGLVLTILYNLLVGKIIRYSANRPPKRSSKRVKNREPKEVF